MRPYLALITLATVPAYAAPADKPLTYNRDIRPILSDKCFACHGFDAKHREADLRLDTEEGAYAKNDGVQAIVPGDLAQSEAWLRIVSADKDDVMPPPKSHKTLTDAEKATIKKWIEQGAQYQKHWAYEAPVKASAGQSIDSFIAARLKDEGLAWSPEADRETLIRRVSFSLTGLPPTVREVDDFLGDEGHGAYERMVDRYLASPRFGEEMAKHWLDIARYADTHGLHLDNERQMWAYRDWVVKAFNDNLSFDQFTIWQLAGDLLPNPTRDQLVATGFNRCNVTTSEGGSIADEYIYRYAVDRTSTTIETWMGLSGGCAVCHDHKFDPISTKEFYSMYAFFQSNADPAMDGNAMLTKPTLRLSTKEQEVKLADFDQKLNPLKKEIAARLTKLNYVDPATIKPPPPVQETETVWIDDDFPAGAKVQTSSGAPETTWITAAQGPVLSGQRALKRAATALAQDFYAAGAAPFEVPAGARFFFNVYLDPANPPEAVMIQFHTGKWESRAVWGNPDVIPYGSPQTPSRFGAGSLPEAGKWAKLEIDGDLINLNAGEKVTGIAFTLHGGTAYFDRMGVAARIDAATDPARSYLAWQKRGEGKDTPGVPSEINLIIKRVIAAKRTPEQEAKVRNYYFEYVCAPTKEVLGTLIKDRDMAQKQRDDFEKSIPSTFIWNDLPQSRDSFVMMRGQYNQPGEKVEPGTLAILPPLQKANPEGRATRLDLAKWLVSPQHPLTARVTVNRFWQQFFGTGLVKTSADFGSQGEPPSHPELLDQLAVEFREGGWDVKKLVRQLVSSQAFRQGARVTPDLLARDPENRLLARGPRFRLDAEQIRDNVLFVSGLMDFTMGGKGVKTYQPPNIWEPVGFVGSNTRFYKEDTGSALYRRSIYTFLKRTAPAPFMVNFDAPNREQSCARRERSNTPLQALQLMNDVQHIEAARALAERMIVDGGATPEERIAFAYRTILSRQPDAEEAKIVRGEFEAHRTQFAQDEEAAKKAVAHGASKPKTNTPPVELAAYTMVANMILNLDETLNRN